MLYILNELTERGKEADRKTIREEKEKKRQRGKEEKRKRGRETERRESEVIIEQECVWRSAGSAVRLCILATESHSCGMILGCSSSAGASVIRTSKCAVILEK